MEETHDADGDGEVRHETHGELHIEARSRGRERTLRRGRLAALREARPSGLSDATFRLPDGVSFVHIVSHTEADRSNAPTSLPAFKAFAAGVRDRCVAAPVRAELTEIGSYGVFGE